MAVKGLACPPVDGRTLSEDQGLEPWRVKEKREESRERDELLTDAVPSDRGDKQ